MADIIKSPKIKIAPSILSADFSKLGEEVKNIEKCGADLIHCDVMDGMFVKNITFGSKAIADMRKHTTLPLDAHLMVIDPERYVDDFIKAKSDFITIHYEACKCLKETLQHIKDCGVKCGVVINPQTKPEKVFDVVPMCDMVLLMSVNPGFGGQKFIEPVLNKVSVMSNFIRQNNLTCDLQIDGGITLENVQSVIDAGANVIVAGNTIFASEDRAKTISLLRGNKA